VRSLNYAVQMTIDRIVFLRICEDRGIEKEGQLKALLNETPIYEHLCELFIEADKRYNSGLFHFESEKGQSSQPDDLTLKLKIDDKALKEIINDLYYPSPYVFKLIPTEILGQVYERFLGKVIRLTAGHQAKVEEKPEVRKAGGVYYTPTYIVDYIVKNTVGKLLEGKTPREAAELKIVDPACGSGSFLLGAYQTLLNWHTSYYNDNEPEKHAKGGSPAIYRAQGAEWKLTTSEKKRILLNNIHGVDIDAQAVEVTKLSLLLKVLEGESQESMGKQLSFLKERALPDLGRNVQCGNSLIGQDYTADRQMSMDFMDEEERQRVNAFDWKAAFPQVFARGGFDAVIGNPPWGADLDLRDIEYIKNNFDVAKTPAIDSYAVFIECGFKKLNPHGLLGLITPDTFLRKNELLPIRSFFLNKTSIKELIETGPLFSQVKVTWCLIFIIGKEVNIDQKIRHIKLSRFIVSADERLNLFGKGNWFCEGFISQKYWQIRPGCIIGYLATSEEQKLICKLEEWPQLGDLYETYKISRGEEGSKYSIIQKANGGYNLILPKDVDYYSIKGSFQVDQNSLTPTKVKSFYNHPKIWIIRIRNMSLKKRLVVAFDERTNSAAMKTLQMIISPNDNQKILMYLSALLGSKLMNFWSLNYLADDMNQSYLSKIPIRTIDFSNSTDNEYYKKIISLVSKMLLLNKESPTTPQEKESLQREIEATDKQIDQLVYDLYGLTEEEIKIVEGE